MLIQTDAVGDTGRFDDFSRWSDTFNGKTQNVELITLISVKPFEIRHFFDAGGTPRCEEVDNKRLPGKYRKRVLVAVKRRKLKKVYSFGSAAAEITGV